MIGKLIRIDYNTQTAQRGKFARIAIELDVSQPLTPDFYLDGAVQLIEYENLPQVCFSCGRIGHSEEECSESKAPPNTQAPPSLVLADLPMTSSLQQTPTLGSDTTSEATATKEAFGLWMVVQRKHRRPNKNGNQTPQMKNQSTKDGRPAATTGNSHLRSVQPIGVKAQQRQSPTPATTRQPSMEGIAYTDSSANCSERNTSNLGYHLF
ncbi:unnamed protein product [Linum tenue]|uniref:CCHC-type domain-containing protein n=1 Tax=Linum tenue TaxID=586396 RepID=A0AAV0RPR7_9ROSI|nr:unnamed protein product [Linum tenue]